MMDRAPAAHAQTSLDRRRHHTDPEVRTDTAAIGGVAPHNVIDAPVLEMKPNGGVSRATSGANWSTDWTSSVRPVPNQAASLRKGPWRNFHVCLFCAEPGGFDLFPRTQ